MHHGLDDELVVPGEIEDGAAGSGVGELDQRLVAEGVLQVHTEKNTHGREKEARVGQHIG